MKLVFRRSIRSVSRSPGAWLTLLLLFVVLVPSFGLLWFMNRAVENERLAVRERLVDAYRAQLIGAQERLISNWHTSANALGRIAYTATPSSVFAEAIRSGAADALICFDASGAITYPAAAGPPEILPLAPDWRAARDLEAADPAAAASAYAQLALVASDPDLAARALQAQARSLAKAGDTAAAFAILDGTLQEERFLRVTDGQGRLIVPYADLMSLELARTIAPEKIVSIHARLLARALDYDRLAMPSAQRRFLLRELQ